MATVNASGPLSLSAIARVFGDTVPYALTDYYRDGASGLVKTNFTKTTTAVPTSGPFAMTTLYGSGTVVNGTLTYSIGNGSINNYTATEAFVNPVGQWNTYYFPSSTITVSGIPSGSKAVRVSLILVFSKELSSYGTTLYARVHKDEEGYPVLLSSSAFDVGYSDYSKKTINIQTTTDVPSMGITNGTNLKFSVTFYTGSTVKIYYASVGIGYGY